MDTNPQYTFVLYHTFYILGSYNFFTFIYIILGHNTKGDFMKLFIKIILFPACLIIACVSIALSIISNTAPKDIYVIRSYKNTVALYQNGTLHTVYDAIVLNTLPERDIISFNDGIAVSSPSEAELFLEDYDG